jgi:hypothetical protein
MLTKRIARDRYGLQRAERLETRADPDSAKTAASPAASEAESHPPK